MTKSTTLLTTLLFACMIIMCQAQANTPPAQQNNAQIESAKITNQLSPKVVKNKEQIIQLFEWMNAAMKNPALITQQSINIFFQPNIHYVINGQVFANNATTLTERLQHLVNIEQAGVVKIPLNHIIVTPTHAAVTYHLTITSKDNKTRTDDITVIMQFKNNKISDWQAVIAHI